MVRRCPEEIKEIVLSYPVRGVLHVGKVELVNFEQKNVYVFLIVRVSDVVL